MRKVCFVPIIAAWCLLGCAGGDQLEANAQEFLKTGQEFATTLETIKDKKTAEDVKDRLSAVYLRFQELERKLNMRSPAEQRRLEEKKHGQEMASLFLKVVNQNLRLRKLPEVMEVFEDTPLYGDFFERKKAP